MADTTRAVRCGAASTTLPTHPRRRRLIPHVASSPALPAHRVHVLVGALPTIRVTRRTGLCLPTLPHARAPDGSLYRCLWLRALAVTERVRTVDAIHGGDAPPGGARGLLAVAARRLVAPEGSLLRRHARGERLLQCGVSRRGGVEDEETWNRERAAERNRSLDA
jgi:hypothetical protein